MLRVTTVHTGSAQGLPYYSTFYFNGDTQSEADAAAAATNTFWNSVDAVVSTTVNITVNQEVEQVDPVTGTIQAIFTTAGGGTVGLDTDDRLSPATQGLLRWRTGVFVGGREIRGRTFIPQPTEGQNTNGKPRTTYTDVLNNAATALIVPGSPGSELVVWSPTHGQSAQVNGRSAWSEWAVLRSRRD